MRWLTILLTVLMAVAGAQATAYYNSSNDFVYTNGSETLLQIHSDINDNEIFSKVGNTYITPYIWISDGNTLQLTNSSETFNITVMSGVLSSGTGSLNWTDGSFNVLPISEVDWVPVENFTTTANNTVHSGTINFTAYAVDRWYDSINYNYSFAGTRNDSNVMASGETVIFDKSVSSEGLYQYNFTFWDGGDNILRTEVYNTYKDNTSLYEGVDNLLYDNRTVSRPDTALSNNVSDTMSISSTEPSMIVHPTDIASHEYILENFTNTVGVEENGVSWNWIGGGSSIDYVNVTRYLSQDVVTFYVTGSGSIGFNLTGMGKSLVYNKYVDGTKTGEVITTSSGVLKDSLTLSTHKVSYQLQTAGGGSTGGGGGGGGGAPVGEETKFCELLNSTILETEWSEEKCVPEQRQGRAGIIYFGHDKTQKIWCQGNTFVPFFSLSDKEECIKPQIVKGKKVYVLGGTWSVTGEVVNYLWEAIPPDKSDVLTWENTPEFQYFFEKEGNWTIRLYVYDTAGYTYTANHSFEVVDKTEEHVTDNVTVNKTSRPVLNRMWDEIRNNVEKGAEGVTTDTTVKTVKSVFKSLQLSKEAKIYAVLVPVALFVVYLYLRKI